MTHPRTRASLLAALLMTLGGGQALAAEAHAPAKPAIAPVKLSDHGKAAPAETHAAASKPAADSHASSTEHAPAGKAEGKAPETLPPSLHPLKPASHPPSAARKLSAGHGKSSSHGSSRKAHQAKAAHGSSAGHDDHGHDSEIGKVQSLVKAMADANSRYMKSKPASYFDKFANKQTPRATVVTCADSRVQTNAFHGDAVNDLFVVRNIGNQLATAEGSVEYGVRHLHTPLLLFIGHAVCGAVAAASGDFSKLERPIQKELLTINIPKGINVNEGVLMNVNNQVESAMLKFGGEVESGKLAVIGAFYDFRNDYKQGRGKLILTNINGETDPARLAALSKAGNFFSAATGMAAPAGSGH